MTRTLLLISLGLLLAWPATTLAHGRQGRHDDSRSRRDSECRQRDQGRFAQQRSLGNQLERMKRRTVNRQRQNFRVTAEPAVRTHSRSCQCSGCGGRSRTNSDTTVVVVRNDSGRGGDTVVVLQDGQRRSDRGYGFSLSNQYGLEHGGFYWDPRDGAPSTPLRARGESSCEGEPGQVLGSSGNLYVQVRADGRLSIRSR